MLLPLHTVGLITECHTVMYGDRSLRKHYSTWNTFLCWWYLSMKPEETEQLVKIHAGLKDIKSWMTSDFFSPYFQQNRGRCVCLSDRLKKTIAVGGIALASNLSVRNFWVTFDWDLYFNSHIKTVSRRAVFHLQFIAKMRKLLTQHDLQAELLSFIIIRMSKQLRSLQLESWQVMTREIT